MKAELATRWRVDLDLATDGASLGGYLLHHLADSDLGDGVAVAGAEVALGRDVGEGDLTGGIDDDHAELSSLKSVDVSASGTFGIGGPSFELAERGVDGRRRGLP